MAKKIIYLDMDGVIAKTYPLDVYKNPECFDTCGIIRGAKEFVNVLARFKETFDFELRILSKTMLLEDDLHNRQGVGKIDWLKAKGLYHFFDEIYILKNNETKAVFAKPDTILIDDYGGNCKEWIRAGGQSIQMFEEKQKEWSTCQTWMELLGEIVIRLETK